MSDPKRYLALVQRYGELSIEETLERIAALEAQIAEARADNERLYAWVKTKDGQIATAEADWKTAEAQLAEARKYATTLAMSMHKQHYAEAAPSWQPLPDLVGLLTQIDNMYAGLRNDLEALKVENKRLVGLPLATLMAERDALRAAWETAKRQNSHDMLLSGDEIHQHNEAIWIAGGRK